MVCFPLDVLRTRLLGPGGAAYGGAAQALVTLVRREGFASLYSGCVPAVLSVMPSGAVFYGVYDMLKVRARGLLGMFHASMRSCALLN
jgi:Mitochondrial carrier protein